MKLKFLSFALKSLVVLYQKFLSFFSVGACRYYPSCSNYALWILEFENPLFAMLKIIIRILRCNQAFKGGFDYPIVRLTITQMPYIKRVDLLKKNIKFWLVPYKKHIFLDTMRPLKQIYTMRFYIIKSI